MNTIHVDVVSAEESIFSGEARFVALPGEAGELGIYPRHTHRSSPASSQVRCALSCPMAKKSLFSWPVAFWKCNPIA